MKYLATALLLCVATSAVAEDMTAKISAQLRPANAEINVVKTRSASYGGRSLEIVCGTVTVRKDAGNYSTRTFAYVVDDDKLWTGEESWLKAPEKMPILQVMKYCPGN